MKYDYKCDDCGNIQEENHRMSEEPTIECSECGSSSTRKYLGNTRMRVLFKGPGFYVNDNALASVGAPPAVRNSAYKNKVL